MQNILRSEAKPRSAKNYSEQGAGYFYIYKNIAPNTLYEVVT